MAILDLANRLLTVRIVYDGCGLAGKTTTLKSLASVLDRAVDAPGEALGRTVYFDWMEYSLSGRAGLKVRCQVVTVPGQKDFRARRNLLLRGADAVIFVFDSSAGRLEENLAVLEEVAQLLDAAQEPRLPLHVQANKRDRPDAVPLESLRELLAEVPKVRIFETVASEARGVREVFSAAVGAALDRAEALSRAGVLSLGHAWVNHSGVLLEELLDAEARGISSESAFGDEDPPLLRSLRRRLTEERRRTPAAHGPQQPKRATLPPGSVWPAKDGPGMLGEIFELAGQGVRLDPATSPLRLGPWRLRILGEGAFPDEGAAARELRRRAKLWQESRIFLSLRRCLAVVPDPAGEQWWLWQAVADLPDLEKLALEVSGVTDPEEKLLWWLHLGSVLQVAKDAFGKAPLELSWDRRSLGLEGSLPVFTDLVGDRRRETRPGDPGLELRLLVDRAMEAGDSDAAVMLQTLRSLRLGNPLLVQAARVLDDFFSSSLGQRDVPHHDTLEVL